MTASASPLLEHVRFEGWPVARRGWAGGARPGTLGGAAGWQSADEELGELAAWVLGQAGLEGGAYRAGSLQRRLPACLRALGVEAPAAARALLEQRPELLPTALSALLIGVTHFFRDSDVFDALGRSVLPGFVRAGRGLRVWSAGCSTGAELYSAAILLAEAGGLEQSELLGTDCRADSIAQARAAGYRAADLGGLAVERRSKHFERHGGTWRPKAALRGRANWRVADLLAGAEDGPWDLILCRNVAIYFSATAAERLWGRLAAALAPGGVLVAGKAERPAAGAGFTRMGRCLYRRPCDLSPTRRGRAEAHPQADGGPVIGPEVRMSIGVKPGAVVAALLLAALAMGTIAYVSTQRHLEAQDTAAATGASRTMLTVTLWMPVALGLLGLAAVAATRRERPAGLPGGPPERWTGTPWGYALAAVAVAVAAALRWRADQAFGDMHATYITFYPAVLLVALVAGGGPGIAATVLSGLVADYAFVEPVGHFAIQTTGEVVSLGIFSATGVGLSFLAERLRRAHWAEAFGLAKEQEAEELARQNEELTQQSEELAQQNEEMQSQAEEIAALNAELGGREAMLQKLLDAARLEGAEERVLDEICAAGRALVGPAAGAVVVYEKQGAAMRIRAQAGLGAAHPAFKPVEHSFADLVLHENRTAAVEDLAKRPDLAVLALPGRAAFGAVLAAPLRQDGRAFGCVAIYAEQPQAWTAEQFRLAEWLAAQCTHILETLRLQQQNRLLSDLLERSEQPFGIGYPDGRLGRVNGAFERLTGYTAAELAAMDWASVLTPAEWRMAEQASLAELARTGQPVRYEKEYQRKDGRRVPIELLVHAVRDGQGQTLYFYSFITDLTQRRQAEAAVRESEAKYRNLFRNMTEEVHFWQVVRDEQGRIATWRLVDANPPALRTWGKTLAEIAGRTTDEIFGAGAKAHYLPVVERIMAEGRPYSYEDYFPHLDRYFRFTSIPLGDYFITTGADISSIKRAQKQIEQQNAELEERVTQRTAQLRALAAELTQSEERERRKLAQTLHDGLQQLLVAAKMRVSVLAKRTPDEAARATLEQVEDLLGQSVQQSRSLTAELSPPILYEAGLRAGLEWLGRWMEEKHGLSVHVGVEDERVGQLPQDIQVFLFQAVREMLFNAAKHAGVDSACVGVRVPEGKVVEVVVEDQGAGFDPGLLQRPQDGSGGFGLFSVRERLELLGGRLEVRSGPGKGMRLTLVVPLRPAAPAAQPPAPEDAAPAAPAPGGQAAVPAAAKAPPRAPAGDARLRVLLADDHKIMREGLVSLLTEHAGFAVVGQAADGQEAVELARNLRPDVVVMDVTMPRLSGVEATRLLMAEFPQLKVIGLSMHGEEEMAAAMRAAGAVAYLRKDTATAALLEALEACRPAPE